MTSDERASAGVRCEGPREENVRWDVAALHFWRFLLFAAPQLAAPVMAFFPLLLRTAPCPAGPILGLTWLLGSGNPFHLPMGGRQAAPPM